LARGVPYVMHLAQGVAYTLQGAEWTARNTAPNTRIALDERAYWKKPAPGIAGRERAMANVFQSYVLMVYPREVEYLRIPDSVESAQAQLKPFDYLFSLKSGESPAQFARQTAWENEHYVIYRLSRQ